MLLENTSFSGIPGPNEDIMLIYQAYPHKSEHNMGNYQVYHPVLTVKH